VPHRLPDGVDHPRLSIACEEEQIRCCVRSGVGGNRGIISLATYRPGADDDGGCYDDANNAAGDPPVPRPSNDTRLQIVQGRGGRLQVREITS
jgi:hypothetical protein